MNLPITVDSSDFTLQSLIIGQKVPKKDGYILLIKWYKCGHCTTYLPIFEQFATQFPNIGFLILESSTNSAMFQQWQELQNPAFEISGYPTVVLYNKEGNPEHVIQSRNELSADIMKMLL